MSDFVGIENKIECCENCKYGFLDMAQRECRRYPPMWPVIYANQWCGEWKEKASEKLPIEQVTLDEIMTDPKYEEIREKFILDNEGVDEPKEPEVEDSPAQPVKNASFYQKGMEYWLKGIKKARDVKEFGKKENK